VSKWRPIDGLLENNASVNQPAVVLVDASMLPLLEQLRRLAPHIILVAVDEQSEAALAALATISIARAQTPADRTRLLAVACELSCARLTAVRRRRQLARALRERRELERIGMDLMQERDQDLLLEQIVVIGKRITGSDLGGLLLAEGDDDGSLRLRIAHVESDTIEDIEIEDRTAPVDDRSVIGHAAKARKPMMVADVYDLPAEASFILEPSFDERHRYRRRSMLIAPMVDHRDHLVGVLVFVNRKTDAGARITSKAVADRYVVPYTNRELRLARSLASQAAVSIENTGLYARIERTLESFVTAAVTAIDQRDPATAGHSLRVATLSTALAEAVDRASSGPYQHVRFTRQQLRELRFAALLHDFGKIAVREDVLIKAKKLPPLLWERIDARFDLIHRTLELDYWKHHSGERESELLPMLETIDRLREIVRGANEPAVLDRPPPTELVEIARRTFELPDGCMAPYLTTEELHYLQLPRGTLDNRERAEIESHVEETYQFLVKIPWTDDLKQVASYAYGHHEKLNGTGYPRKLSGEQIPLQTRIITIADIFDALTQADRPYKPAVAPERALEVLKAEAKAGVVDADLLQIMLESRSYRKILDEDRLHRVGQ
jgi:HD-GYP domain-containing protein (c-di-GMP phosphodiesterase class II)